ncbi:hypothetical protein [Sphingobium sp.]|jgi:hypothetical protein|uniref:hypothetical protein n=1 Tax=Sphingobium sp. TaxID=1912891 RepID=UPI0011216184|nr:hypothetical protein [Sphingobium sp.]
MNLPQDPQVMTASFVGAPGCSRPLAAILRQRDGKAACLNLMRGNRRLNVLEGSMIALLRHHHPLDYPSDVGVSNNLQN